MDVQTLAVAQAYTDKKFKDVAGGSVSEEYLKNLIDAELDDSLVDYDERIQLLEASQGLADVKNTDWTNILEVIDSGNGARYYPIGTQVVEQYTYSDTGYETPHNVVHFDKVELEDGSQKNAMYLEWEYAAPLAMAFCEKQALQTFDGTDGATDGLPAGKYAFYVADIASAFSTAKSFWNEKYVVFELSKDIPSGGQIRNSSIDNAKTWSLKTTDGYLATSTELETVTCTVSSTIPEDATYLGATWGEDVGYGILNHIDCVMRGDNTWRDSDIRMWLNSDSSDWWEKKTRYSVQSSKYTEQGFLCGYSDEFKSLLKPVKVQTYANTVKGNEGIVTTYDRIFLHSSIQINSTTPNSEQYNTDTEGCTWDYYKELAVGESNLDTNGRFVYTKTYSNLKRFLLTKQSQACNYGGRTAIRTSGYQISKCSQGGTVGSDSTSNILRWLPACAICK